MPGASRLGLILTRLAVRMDTPCKSIILKYQNDRAVQRRVIALLGEVLGLDVKRLALRCAALSQGKQLLPAWKTRLIT